MLCDDDVLQHLIHERVLRLVKQNGVVRPRDVEALGIPREYLLRLMRRGLIERTARGLYQLPDAPVTEHHTLAEVGKRVPEATICLISALSFHGLTTQIPHRVWIALRRGSRTPNLDFVKLAVMRISGPALTHGRVEERIEGVPVVMTTPAKTVADCFKFRNTVGLDVAVEGLRECLRQRKATPAQIMKAADVCRVAKLIRPYLDALA